LRLVGTFAGPVDHDITDRGFGIDAINRNGTVAFMSTGDRGNPWLVDVSDPAHAEPLVELQDVFGDGFYEEFSPDGKLLAVAATSPTAIYDITHPSDPVLMSTLSDEDEGAAGEPMFSPDSRLLIIGNQSDLRFWDVSDPGTPRLAASLPEQSPLAVSPDGKRLVTQIPDGTLQLWRLGPDGPTKKLSSFKIGGPGEGHVVDVRFSADSDTIITSGGGSGTVRLWDVSDPTDPDKIAELPRQYDNAAIDTGLRDPILAVATNESVTLWDIRKPAKARLVTTKTHDVGNGPIQFSTDGSRLAVGNTIWRIF
jgi:WD40 repeat protein